MNNYQIYRGVFQFTRYSNPNDRIRVRVFFSNNAGYVQPTQMVLVPKMGIVEYEKLFGTAPTHIRLIGGREITGREFIEDIDVFVKYNTKTKWFVSWSPNENFKPEISLY